MLLKVATYQPYNNLLESLTCRRHVYVTCRLNTVRDLVDPDQHSLQVSDLVHLFVSIVVANCYLYLFSGYLFELGHLLVCRADPLCFQLIT